ncbi:hypothetical protein PAAG_11981 [Paracoccidioides lutzii Pb01]|uniref:RBR-type E3 ubiquitin transferase n=1 Tax=Paracoccidioides lutzii (strain ATCC MYA-826 / Pb01) TaxID=502779 RepID=A0A0A2VK88_PARBA|nr:hypothetical protein PAAG_11981 [Paracoccidioides lutzii Pb01]KGQ01304.1 hypothetical protein PAAG_11981 [Paracoccidioides lutzii Pb01]
MMDEFSTIPAAKTRENNNNQNHYSDIRQVPDNQEVFMSQDTQTSIIIEIVERLEPEKLQLQPNDNSKTNPDQEEVAQDMQAVKAHIHEICEVSGDSYELISSTGPIEVLKLPDTPAYMARAHILCSIKRRGEEPASAARVAVSEGIEIDDEISTQPETATLTCQLLLIRLKEEETDIIAYVVVPHKELERDGGPVDAKADEIASAILTRLSASFDLPYTFFTTPPQAKKRSACEAVVDNTDKDLRSIITGSDRAAVRKRVGRALEDSGDPSPTPKRVPDLATPATTETTTSMDSEEELISDGSSQEDMLDMQGSDDESLGDDFGDDDLGGSFYDKEIIKQPRKPYEVDFKVLSPEDIRREQNMQINEVASILGLPPESAAILLRFTRWNREKLIESYMEDNDRIQEEAGVGAAFSGTPKTEVIPGFVCDICCEDRKGLESYAMRCGHRFCVDCYRHYLGQKIREEGEAARIQCPQNKCHRIVDSKTLDLLVTEDLQERYHRLLIRTYVDDKYNLKWCPAPNCEFAIDCGVKKRDLNRVVPTVHCRCSHSFCFGCSLNDHQPPPCSLVKKWLKKCKDDSETANWISAHTKECPKCSSTIEKNGGCNHMTCRKCKHEFCWMCMGLWSEHGTSWYNCNRFEEKSGASARDAQARSRQSLERYLHYYNRYANHEQSAKLDKDLYLKTEKKMMSLQSQSGLSWIEVQFLDTASQALQQCRQTLKWTYAFAFYLARNNLTEIFEDNQKDLEMAVESLSEMFEKPIDQLSALKIDILDKTAYCNKRRVILLSDTAENLKNRMYPTA